MNKEYLTARQLTERDMNLLGEAIERIADGLNFAGYRDD